MNDNANANETNGSRNKRLRSFVNRKSDSARASSRPAARTNGLNEIPALWGGRSQVDVNMSSKIRCLAVGLCAMLVLSVVGPGLAMAGAAANANANLHIDVQQNDVVEVTVTDDDGDGVDNATVNVTVTDDDADYENQSKTTDQNGTVEFSTPEEVVNITIEAEKGDRSTSESVELIGSEEEEEGGDENDEPPDSFGQMVTDYVHSILKGDAGDENKTVGQQVATFVVENNPGNAPDHAGPPDQAGSLDHAGPDGDEEQGPPEHAGQNENNGTDDERGPPDHARANDVEANDASADEEGEEEDEKDDKE